MMPGYYWINYRVRPKGSADDQANDAIEREREREAWRRRFENKKKTKKGHRDGSDLD